MKLTAGCTGHSRPDLDTPPLTPAALWGVPDSYAQAIATRPFCSLIVAVEARCSPCALIVADVLAGDPAQVLYGVLNSAITWQRHHTSGGPVLDYSDTACLSRPYREIITAVIDGRTVNDREAGWTRTCMLDSSARTAAVLTAAKVAIEAVTT
jgi:hypothetical protein